MSNYEVLPVIPPFTVLSVVSDPPEEIPYNVRMLGAPLEWAETKGAGIKVAVIDTGATPHPDLKYAAMLDFGGSGDPKDYKGHGCIAPGDYILTSYCGLQTIENFFEQVQGVAHFLHDGSVVKEVGKQNIFTVASDQEGNTVRGRIVAVHKLPYRGLVYEVTTNVEKLTLTPWHPVYVFDGQTIGKKRADELNVDDNILLACGQVSLTEEYKKVPFKTYWKCKHCGHEARGGKRKYCRKCNAKNWNEGPTVEYICLDEELAYFLGLIMSDGHVMKGSQSIEFSNNDLSLMREFERLSLKLFGKKAYYYDTGRTGRFRARIHDRDVYNLVEYLGITVGNKSKVKKVPYLITKSPRSVIMAFVAGYLDGNGNINRKFRDKYYLRLITGSRHFADELFLLLRTLGIGCRLSEQKGESLRGKYITWVITMELVDEVAKYLKSERFTTKIKEGSVTSSKFRKTAKVLDIKQVNYEGYMYDLTVDGYHNYIANGMVVSNTHVAGTVAANGKIKGVAPEVELYSLKVADASGRLSVKAIARALYWCRDNKVDVVNMSLGGPQDIQEIKAACQACYDSGIILVASAGNYGAEFGVLYPAKYPTTIAVAAVDIHKIHPGWSAIGKELDVAAAGVQVWSTWLEGKYALLDGTSMAAPAITGAVALLQSKALIRFGKKLTPDQVRLLLQIYAEDVGVRGPDDRYGFGVFSFGRFNEDENVTKPVKTIEMKIGQKEYYVDGVKKEMDVAPFIQNNRTFVPVRFVAEGLGGKVDWIKEERKVKISL